MTSDVANFFDKWQLDRQKLKDQAPDVARGFGGFYQTVMKEGALSVREKELIAMAIGLAHRCTPCINLHVQGCVKAGATRVNPRSGRRGRHDARRPCLHARPGSHRGPRAPPEGYRELMGSDAGGLIHHRSLAANSYFTHVLMALGARDVDAN